MKKLITLLSVFLFSFATFNQVNANTYSVKQSVAHITKSGKPDKRYTASKHLKKDGTPDMRYKANKQAAGKTKN